VEAYRGQKPDAAAEGRARELRAVRRQICAQHIRIPSRDCTSEELAEVLSDYIKLFDELMKGYLTGG
jgi:hypothetical protein